MLLLFLSVIMLQLPYIYFVIMAMGEAGIMGVKMNITERYDMKQEMLLLFLDNL